MLVPVDTSFLVDMLSYAVNRTPGVVMVKGFFECNTFPDYLSESGFKLAGRDERTGESLAVACGRGREYG